MKNFTQFKHRAATTHHHPDSLIFFAKKKKEEKTNNKTLHNILVCENQSRESSATESDSMNQSVATLGRLS